jgi:acyl-CoA thioester hydrolase
MRPSSGWRWRLFCRRQGLSNHFTQTFTAGPEHIDILGHVNNAVWVQWMEAIATAHWESDARPEDVATYIWVVTRHEIDYRGNIREGESVLARTFIPDPAEGGAVRPPRGFLPRG